MNDVDREIFAQALSQFKYWLEATDNPRVSASIANKRTDLMLTVKEYRALMEEKFSQHEDSL